MFIDAVCIYGETKQFDVTLNTLMSPDDTTTEYIEHDGEKFVPLDLSNYAIKFKILGSATADAEVLTEHLITQVTNIEVDGCITNPTNGEFTFTITDEDTKTIGFGKHPIMIELVDIDTYAHIQTITEGGANGEFNKIYVIQV